MIFAPLFNVAIAGIAIFLVGSNAAFLINLGNKIVAWFKFKIIAVELLLTYIVISLLYGNPTIYRVVIAAAAIIIDCLALAYMWKSVSAISKKGIIGFIPLIVMTDKELERHKDAGV